MINPRSLVRALDKHWEIIEYLVALGREYVAFDRDELLALLAKVYPTESSEQQLERLQQLVNNELLITLSHSDNLQTRERADSGRGLWLAFQPYQALAAGHPGRGFERDHAQ